MRLFLKPPINDRPLGSIMQIAAFTTVKNKQSITLIVAKSFVKVDTFVIGFSYEFIMT